MRRIKIGDFQIIIGEMFIWIKIRLRGECKMSKVLYIKANPKPDSESNTFRLSNEFIEEYKRINPSDEVIPLDLYKEGIKPLDGEMVKELFAGVENDIKRHALLFASADKYVVAAPMWNLSIPAMLKAYIDYVTYVGITFKYTEEGPVGLLADKSKKAIHIVTRGGAYSEGPAASYELGDKYLRTIFAFMGIQDFRTLKLELTNVLQGEQLEGAKKRAYTEAKTMAMEF
jgi:FMN-dependent NADH-azoreductase